MNVSVGIIACHILFPSPPQGLYVCGKPNMTAFAIGSSDPMLGIFAVADVMEKKGSMLCARDLFYCMP